MPSSHLVNGIQITHNEFTQFMLRELKLVDDDYFVRIDDLFQALDTSGDGRLSMDDVRHMTAGSLPAVPATV